MDKLTDQAAANLILQLMPRITFKGDELQAVAALQNWALSRTGTVPGTPRVVSQDEPELPLAAAG